MYNGRPVVFVAMPVYKEIHPKTKKCLEKLLDKDTAKYNYHFVPNYGDALIDRARSVLLAQFLQPHPQLGEYDFFLQLDSDIGFEPEDIEKLISRGLDVVGGAYPYKREGGDIVYRRKPEATIWNGLVGADFLGTGCLLVSRFAIDTLIENYPELRFKLNPDIKLLNTEGDNLHTYAFFQPMCYPQPVWGKGEHEYLSEDYAFCARLARCGFEIWLDSTVCLQHFDKDKEYEVRKNTKVQQVKHPFRCPSGGFKTTVDMAPHVQKVFAGEYDIDLEIKNPKILDIGACHGDFSVWALHKWRDAEITAYEPMPDNYDLLKQNIGKLDQVTLKNVAVVPDKQYNKMSRGPNNLGESHLSAKGDIEVKTMLISKLPSADIIKMDVEGTEGNIVQGYQHWDSVSAVMMEYHSDDLLKAIRHRMIELGFTLVHHNRVQWGRGTIKFMRKDNGDDSTQESS